MNAETTIVATTRTRLGSVGTCAAALRTAPIQDEVEAVRRLEAMGYRSVWCGEEIGGKDAFAHACVVLAGTSTIVYGTGIANIWARHPATMQGAAETVAAGWPGRLVLGVGVSHSGMVERSGQHYGRPLARMRQYLNEMDAVTAGGPSSTARAPRILAALRPRMLELAREKADGAYAYFVPPTHAPFAREILGTDRLLITEQAVLLCSDPVEARREARRHMAEKLNLPNYVNSLRHLGFGDDLSSGGSDRLVDALVAWGDSAAIAGRVRELLAAGADHVVIQPVAQDLGAVVDQYQELAAAVLIDE